MPRVIDSSDLPPRPATYLGTGAPGMKARGYAAAIRAALLQSLCPSASFAQLGVEPGLLRALGIAGWNPCNPSVAVHEGQLWVTVRVVNYSMKGGVFARPAGVGGRALDSARTVNLLAPLDPMTLRPTRPWRAVKNLDPAPRVEAHAIGLEDLRLFSMNGRLWASGTYCERIGRAEMVLCEMSPEGDVVSLTAQPTNKPIEKNWMPVVREDALCWIYTCEPTIVRAPGKGAVLLHENESSVDLAATKGSSQLVPWGEDHFLAVVHETIEGRSRTYLHRLVEFAGADLHITRVSRLFTFTGTGIEFCAGMARHGAGKLVMSFGIEDCSAWLVEVSESDLEALLAGAPVGLQKPASETESAQQTQEGTEESGE